MRLGGAGGASAAAGRERQPAADEENPRVELTLVGQGSTRAAFTFEPATLDFGRVAECASAVQLLTVTSTGTAGPAVRHRAREASSGWRRSPSTGRNVTLPALSRAASRR